MKSKESKSKSGRFPFKMFPKLILIFLSWESFYNFKSDWEATCAINKIDDPFVQKYTQKSCLQSVHW